MLLIHLSLPEEFIFHILVLITDGVRRPPNSTFKGEFRDLPRLDVFLKVTVTGLLKKGRHQTPSILM